MMMTSRSPKLAVDRLVGDVRFHEYHYIRDTSQVPQILVFGMGLFATVICSIFMATMRGSGWTTLDLETILGSLFTARLSHHTWWLGFSLSLFINGFVAYAYGFIFRSAHRTGPAVGAHLGFFHWLVSGFLIGLIPIFHPLIGEILPAPGFYVLATNPPTVLTFLILHLLYGSLLGWLFDRASLRVTTQI
jgi:magnesium-transporting ATPase (P-type)